MKTLEQIKEFVKGTAINTVYTPQDDYPFFFLGEESVGWGEYIDFNTFDPFYLLGFTENVYRIEVSQAYYKEHGYDVDGEITDIFHKSETLTEALDKVKALTPEIEITFYPNVS